MTDQEVAVLAAEYPGWRFGSVWQSAGNRPDYKNLTATRNSDGVLVTAPTVAALREQIRHEEASG